MHYTQEQAEVARAADLYDYLMRYHGDQVKLEGNSLRMISNHSITIKRGFNYYKDWATDETGHSITLLVKYFGYTYPEAIIALSGGVPGREYHPAFKTPTVDIKDPVVFPDPVKGPYKQLYAYLIKTRGISKGTIDMLIRRGILYQSEHKSTDGGKTYANIVFANKARDWGEKHGTISYGDSHHGVLKNARHDGFWGFMSNPERKEPGTIYVCEAAIDAISLYELYMQAGMIEPATFVSIGGSVAKQHAIDRLKRQFGDKVVLAVDNDVEAGPACRANNPDLCYILPEGGKDWNEMLTHNEIVNKAIFFPLLQKTFPT